MKKFYIAALACCLAACTSTTYTEATRAEGSTVKHVSIAAGTKINTVAGGCIDSVTSAHYCIINKQ